jgi:hypothetical protein
MVTLIGTISRETMGAGTPDTVTQVESHGSHVLVAMEGQGEIDRRDSAGLILTVGTAGKLTANSPIQQTQMDIRPGMIGTLIGSTRAMIGDMTITMKEMIGSLIGSLQTTKGTMIGLMTGTVAGMMIGMMTGRLIGLSQESRTRTVFSVFYLATLRFVVCAVAY